MRENDTNSDRATLRPDGGLGPPVPLCSIRDYLGLIIVKMEIITLKVDCLQVLSTVSRSTLLYGTDGTPP